jgi:hypothetical protein
MLQADGYEIELNEMSGKLIVEIKAGPDACPDCLVPKNMMRTYLETALRENLGDEGVPEVKLVYPADSTAR